MRDVSFHSSDLIITKGHDWDAGQVRRSKAGRGKMLVKRGLIREAVWVVSVC